MTHQYYATGEEIRVGDMVDLGYGHGPKGIIVVLIPDGPASSEFDATEWSYLGTGFMLRAEGMGLVHYPAADDELLLVARA